MSSSDPVQNGDAEQDSDLPELEQNGNARNNPETFIAGPTSVLRSFLGNDNFYRRARRGRATTRAAANIEIPDSQEPSSEAGSQLPEETRSTSPSEAPIPASKVRSRQRSKTTPFKTRQNVTRKASAADLASKKRKKRAPDSDDDDDDDDYEDDTPMGKIMDLVRCQPGQVDHCELCLRKFTVTPYTKTGPDGGLLCADCGRVTGTDKKPDVKRPKLKPPVKGLGKKRQIQSRIMDRTFKVGAKDLATLCVEVLAKNVEEAVSLGSLPDHLVDKVARLLSKRRLVDGKTLSLFIQPTTNTLKIYDAGKLTDNDLMGCFAVSQNLKTFKIVNGIHFTDSVMAYLLTRPAKLVHFSIHGANLLSDKAWIEFLQAQGPNLRTLKVHFTDKHFGEDIIKAIVEYCPDLKCLSLSHIALLTSKGIRTLAALHNLEYLSLQLNNNISPDALQDLVKAVGGKLTTLSLRKAYRANNRLLEVIGQSCPILHKLRITECDKFTDDAFVQLFNQWGNRRLEFIEFSKCRHLDSSQATNPESGIGLCSNGFRTLMAKQMRKLRHVNVEGSRYITAETFDEVFAGGKVYPDLQHVEVSFCEKFTDEHVDKIFKACPALKELVVFGCLRVQGLVRVPRGKLLIGVPNVMGMIIEGTYDEDV